MKKRLPIRRYSSVLELFPSKSHQGIVALFCVESRVLWTTFKRARILFFLNMQPLYGDINSRELMLSKV